MCWLKDEHKDLLKDEMKRYCSRISRSKRLKEEHKVLLKDKIKDIAGGQSQAKG